MSKCICMPMEFYTLTVRCNTSMFVLACVCFLLLDSFCNTNSGWISAACDSTVNLKAVCNIYVVTDMLRCLFCKSAR